MAILDRLINYGSGVFTILRAGATKFRPEGFAVQHYGDPRVITDEAVKESWNGGIIGSPAVSVASDGADWTLSLAGGLLQCIFEGVRYPFDCTTPQTLGLTEGTNASPINTFVWLKLTGSTVFLDSGTVWPSVPYCPIALVLLQAAASPSDTDGAYKVHAWTDHIKDAFTGHSAHIAENIRNRAARWWSGCAASVTIGAGSVDVDIEEGEVRQLHLHVMRVIDTGAGDPIYIANQPVSEGGAYDRLTNLDDLTTDAAGNSLDGKHFPLFLWGSVSEATADDKFWLNLPLGVYNTQSQAELDLERHVVTEIPADFIGTGFPIAKLVMKANLGGTWVLHELIDLRKTDPEGGGGGGSGIVDHDSLPKRDLGSNHAAAIAGSPGISGFLLGTDKTKLDNTSGTNTGDEAAASDTVAGVVELATEAETKTGTDATRAVTPAGMIGHEGMVKAWINFNGQGTVAINDSFNVSGLTDRGTGQYTPIWDTDFANPNYAVAGMAKFDSSNADVNFPGVGLDRESSNPAVGSIKIVTAARTQTGGQALDAEVVTVMAIGDQ